MSETQNPRESEPTPTRTIGQWMLTEGSVERTVDQNQVYPNRSTGGLLVPEDDMRALGSIARMVSGEVAINPDLSSRFNAMAIDMDAGEQGILGYLTFTGEFPRDTLDHIGAQLVDVANEQLDILGADVRLPSYPSR